MRPVYTECMVRVFAEEGSFYGSHRIIIRVDSQGAGPYLVVRGENDSPDAGDTKHDFFLHSEDEIDTFANICKDMLRQAEQSEEPES